MEVCGYYLNEKKNCLYLLTINEYDDYVLFRSFAPFYNKLFLVDVTSKELREAIKTQLFINIKKSSEKILVNNFFNFQILLEENNKFPKNTIMDISYCSSEKIQSGMIMYLGSTFENTQNIYIYNPDDTLFWVYNFKKKKLVIHKPSMELSHQFISKSRIPCIITNIRSNKFVFYLHGGPNYFCDYSYDEVTKKLVEKGLNVIKINYCGSIGYSKYYEEKLLNNGSIADIDSIKKVITFYHRRFPDMKYILWGDSYGGYLANIFSLNEDEKMNGIVTTGGFTNIDYMLLFSDSREIILKFLNNPNARRYHADLMNSMNKVPLIFIHGSNDKSCPIFPIKQLANKNTKIKLVELNDFNHYEYLPRKKKQKSCIVVKEICQFFSNSD
jgi:dipeptidyl aminopeptidase/acylaminoacyl peptidase